MMEPKTVSSRADILIDPGVAPAPCRNEVGAALSTVADAI